MARRDRLIKDRVEDWYKHSIENARKKIEEDARKLGEDAKKKIKDLTVHLRPEADTDLTFAWSIDDNAEQTELVDQLGVHVPLGTFLLDTDQLADKNILLISKTNLRGITEGYVISFNQHMTIK